MKWLKLPNKFNVNNTCKLISRQYFFWAVLIYFLKWLNISCINGILMKEAIRFHQI